MKSVSAAANALVFLYRVKMPRQECWLHGAALFSDVPHGMDVAEAFCDSLQEGEAARLRMCKSNERLVWHVARKYQNRGLDIEDLVAEGMIGLLKGVEKYDPEKGFKFSTYAHWWVRQGVTRAISEQVRAAAFLLILHPCTKGILLKEQSLANV